MSISFKNLSFSLRTNSINSDTRSNSDNLYVNYILSNFIVSSIYLPNTNNLSHSLVNKKVLNCYPELIYPLLNKSIYTLNFSVGGTSLMIHVMSRQSSKNEISV